MTFTTQRCRPNGRDLGLVIDAVPGSPTCELAVPPNEDPQRRMRIDRVIVDESSWYPWVEVLIGKPGDGPPEEPKGSRTLGLVRVRAFATFLQAGDVG